MIQPEPEGSTQGYPLDSVEVLRINTTAGNPVKEILLKLNLPDHRSIFTDSKEQIKMEIERRSVKAKELRERCIIKAFKLKNQGKYEHVDPKVASTQDGKTHKMANIDYDWMMISRNSKIAYKLKSKEYLKPLNDSFDQVRIIETDDIVEKTHGTMGVQMLILICVFSKFELASIKKVDRYNEDNEHHVTTTERSDVLPLLANKANDTNSEHIKKYRWLLKRFNKIFGKAPKVVVTDQDPTMKVAIEEIFPESRHRLCMWHTMKKLAGKVKYVPSDCSVQCSCLRNVEQSVTHLAGDLEKLNFYTDAQKTLMAKAKTDVPNPPKMNTNAVYASTLGVTEPEKIDILVPRDINNKGNRIRTRLKSNSEIAMKLSDKPKRLCNFCKKYANRDSRNCPLKKTGLQDEDVDDVEQDEDEDADMYPSD
ncbi:FAR1 DNA binding domain, zinc finger, SWIM-type, MULE transposase domain containing protein [Tanacetum coccineum]